MANVEWHLRPCTEWVGARGWRSESAAAVTVPVTVTVTVTVTVRPLLIVELGLEVCQ